MTQLNSPDKIVLFVPVGLAIRSAADRVPVRNGLHVSAEHATNTRRKFNLMPTPSGFWTAHQLPGTSAELADDPFRWVAEARPYKFSVVDQSRQYLPMRFQAPLPKRNALVWPGWAGVNRDRIAPLLPPGSAPDFEPDYLPIFPSTSASGSSATARILAHLAVRHSATDIRPACWALVTISFGAKVIGIGMSDSRGATMINFAYPSMPTPTPAEAAAGRSNVRWQIRADIYSTDLGNPKKPDDPPPDFSQIIAQLASSPRVAMSTTQGPQPPLGAQTLSLGEPLTLRSRNSPTEFASSLFLKP
ncbi:MAG: hypothetical protein ABL928_03380 [Sphingorhabdus sp.]